MNVSVCLSKLVAGRQNPRRVKPERDAHRRLVASIRAYGLLEPLVVHTVEDGKYRVIAGNRRLSALREVHRGDDAKVPCIAKNVDDDTAASMSLAENFAREPMHPLDEAEAFARLAREECKGVAIIAEEFGVSDTYVRQRMKLAGLADPVKAALRANEITAAIAEAFAAVPPERQEELWREVGGNPRHAQHVRNLIENAWIAATHALFDVAILDPTSVSHDLFGGNVLVERTAFMKAQEEALAAERSRLIDEGWREAVVCTQDAVQDRLYAMDEAEPEYDRPIARKLKAIALKRDRQEAIEPKDDAAAEKITARLEALDDAERALIAGVPARYSEATKAAGTTFLILYPDGRVERHYRTPRLAEKGERGTAGSNGVAHTNGQPDPLPTSDEISDRQRAHLFTHKALAVREALSKNKLARKRLLVLALHRRVNTDAVSIRRNVNGTTLHAEGDSLRSALFDAQRARLAEIDPFAGDEFIEEIDAYAKITKLTEKELDALIAVLVVESMTGHGQRATPLVTMLGKELGVSLRTHWTPDADWLAGYTKAQLAELTGKLRGKAHGAAALSRKKSELVAELDGLFKQATEAPKSVEDQELAERVNAWLPAAVTEEDEAE